MPGLPEGSRYVVIGAGVHGLSTAWHPATELKARGRGSGEDVVVLDKIGIGSELMGEGQALLEPLRFSRYADGRLHPVSHSLFPWS
jgi:glycine/D-amino acid oxidase-like deaminating enzyme